MQSCSSAAFVLVLAGRLAWATHDEPGQGGKDLDGHLL
jgi:hypothetical protein